MSKRHGSSLRVDILTIFPEVFPPILGHSIIGRAIAKGILHVEVHNLRDWSKDKHRKVDDRPYGGGPGMVMKPEPFFDAVDDLKQRMAEGTPWVILCSPQGERLTQARVRALAERPWLIFLCGHYEGIDERVRLGLANQTISIGDYVLTCGELPAMVIIDSVARLLPGVLGDPRSALEDSFTERGLEYPQYTRPAEYRGLRVPEVLLSGDERRIADWRELNALLQTMKIRPELMHGSTHSSD